jgi:hypothetical protein
MATQIGALDTAPMPSRDEDVARAYAEGIRAGLVGAVTIALWFGVLDVLWGRPLYTPMVLGTAIFKGGAGLEHPETLVPSLEIVMGFTFIHMLAFLLVGMAAGRLVMLAQSDSHLGFGILLLFFVFEVGFLWACMLFAEPVLQALAWPAIVVGNLLAAAAMVATFWRRHRDLAIQP